MIPAGESGSCNIDFETTGTSSIDLDTDPSLGPAEHPSMRYTTPRASGADAAPAPVFSPRLSWTGRFLRALKSALDLRAYLHLLRILNFYNHSHVIPRRRIAMGRDCTISSDVNFMHGERIRLGDRVSLASRCFLWAGPGHGTITLEDDVLLGPEVLITVATYNYDDGTPVTAQAMRETNVHIGRDVWIGCRAMIMPGVTLGAGCVVGAGAVVTRSFPAGSVIVGAPARLVRIREYPPRAQ